MLVVDDEPAVADLLCRLLEKEGYGVHIASDGTAALQAVLDHRPPVVLLDVNMPRSSGIHVLLLYARSTDSGLHRSSTARSRRGQKPFVAGYWFQMKPTRRPMGVSSTRRSACASTRG